MMMILHINSSYAGSTRRHNPLKSLRLYLAVPCMASQPPSESVEFEIESFVRGYHAYMNVWEPRIGEVLALEREPHNVMDQLAISVVKSGLVVDHVPFNLAPVFSHFLATGCRCPASTICMGLRLTWREPRPCSVVT